MNIALIAARTSAAVIEDEAGTLAVHISERMTKTLTPVMAKNLRARAAVIRKNLDQLDSCLAGVEHRTLEPA